MGQTFYFLWELELIEFLQHFTPELIVHVFSSLTILGDEVAMIAVGGFFYWCYDKKVGKRLILNLGFVNILYPMIKNIFYRRRPYMDSDQIECLKPVDEDYDIYDLDKQGYSFPSGHTANSVSVYGQAFLKYRSVILRVVFGSFIVLVAVSRVILGVHYPTDVLVGFLLGAFTIWLFDFLDKKMDKKKYYLMICLLPLIGFAYCTSNDFYTGYGILLGGCLADLFEEKYVNFENTRKPLVIVIRMVLGFVIYFVLSALLKLPFRTEFLETKSFLPFLVRTVRYTIVIFVELGVYPLLFKRIK